MKDFIKKLDIFVMLISVLYVVDSLIYVVFHLYQNRSGRLFQELRIVFVFFTIYYFVNLSYFAFVRTPLRFFGYKTLYLPLLFTLVVTFLAVALILSCGGAWS